ncbi:MFS transporter, partial [Pseudarthrobacter sp. H3Y2-7]|uniref:MFS transporter n=1 Tax=Pseudarthrobacter naphthalenicus TaxID=3031328 RepID=UPI0023B1F992
QGTWPGLASFYARYASQHRRKSLHRDWLEAVTYVKKNPGPKAIYPALLAAIGDVAHPLWRARSVGILRLWRDGGFAVGALLSGVLADAYGIPAAVLVVAALTAASGILVALRMRGTDHNIPLNHQRGRRPARQGCPHHRRSGGHTAWTPKDSKHTV